jgi:hypothetical protein
MRCGGGTFVHIARGFTASRRASWSAVRIDHDVLTKILTITA